MSPTELEDVLGALVAAHTELEALVDDDIHVPSGDLMEQLEDAIRVLESKIEG